jgi:wobble nucleotide-excising tRNase
MSCERFSLLRNIGQFNSVNAGAQIPLSKLTLIYAENGRGKTTLAASQANHSWSTNGVGWVRSIHRISF